jgi:Fungal specific transcription factor domain
VVDRGILDPVKTRYMGLHSVMAFPRNLGLEFQSANPPRVHSFAWNCGIRPEENGTSHVNLKDLVTRGDFELYKRVYFEAVHPVFGILDKQIFSRNADQFWSETGSHSSFEAILAGVVALGSFFSATLGHPRELEIVQHAKNILEDSVISRRVSRDQVSAWILRTLYLRSTTRPHIAWLASNIAMHLAEATGIHHEMDAVVLTTDSSSQIIPSQDGCEQSRRLFWSAWMINSMISYEYGRSSSSLNNITCKQPTAIKDDYTTLLISVAQLVPRESLDAGPNLHHTLPKIQQIPDDHPFISMSKADLCMALYRHHRLLKHPIEKKEILQIISIGNTATEAAYKLAQENKFWWNVLCTVFQYVCVLLAIDSLDSLAQVQSAMCTLENIAGRLQTHVSTEAVNTLKILLRDSMKKKRQEVQLLEAADPDLSANTSNGLGGMENVDINWDALLDPWYLPTLLPQQFNMGAEAAGMLPTV